MSVNKEMVPECGCTLESPRGSASGLRPGADPAAWASGCLNFLGDSNMGPNEHTDEKLPGHE